MAEAYKDHAKRLRLAAGGHSKTFGAQLCVETENAAGLLLSWLGHLRAVCLTGTGDELIHGTQAAIVEVAGCLSLGLVRPAMFSMRGQMDMCLSWLFFRHHHVEWQHVQDRGKGFMLKSDVIRYLETYCPPFKMRLALLREARTRREEDPYRLLSAHVHSQSVYAVPGLDSLQDMVADVATCRECVTLQHETSEYLSDTLLACFAEDWADLPDDIMDNAKERLRGDLLQQLCM